MAAAVGRPKGPTLTWSGRGVDVQAIEDALTRLRQEAAGAAAAGEEAFAFRTSVLNLVAYASDEEAGRRAERVIAGLPSHHPSRSLIVVAQPEAAETAIDARLAAHCHLAGWLPRGGSPVQRQVCCEELTLRVRGQAARHLHSVIIPLLVSDLPVLVWWTGDLPRDEHLLDEMLAMADRFIVDSARFAEPERALPRLAGLCAGRGNCPLADLSWGRTAPWRELLAQLFDDPSLRPILDALSRLEVRCAAGAHPIQGLLLAGWLASCLRWRSGPLSRRGQRLTGEAEADGRQIGIELASVPAEGEPGAIVALGLEAGDAGSVSIALAEEGHASFRVEAAGSRFEGRAPLHQPDEGELLSGELAVQGRDRLQEEARETAIKLQVDPRH